MELEYEHFPVSDILEHEILMHRDVHFGGRFEEMLAYYSQEGKGVQEDFTLTKIEELFLKEREIGENLSEILLSETEKEKVLKALDTYEKLRDIYEHSGGKPTLPSLIADLILSEEESPEEEIEALVEHGEVAIPHLENLLTTDEFYDPLFPGYSYAPLHAAECLGRIGSEKSVRPLFEKIGTGEFTNEESVIAALKALGKPAENFLLSVLGHTPISIDNERAAIALLEFPQNPDIATHCLEILEKENLNQYPVVALYLILGCEALEDPKKRERFLALKKSPNIPSQTHIDIDMIARSWKSKA
ncbi:MAG: hypothetical protein Tsb0021_10660 [Chlamydiales bacterium]